MTEWRFDALAHCAQSVTETMFLTLTRQWKWSCDQFTSNSCSETPSSSSQWRFTGRELTSHSWWSSQRYQAAMVAALVEWTCRDRVTDQLYYSQRQCKPTAWNVSSWFSILSSDASLTHCSSSSRTIWNEKKRPLELKWSRNAKVNGQKYKNQCRIHISEKRKLFHHL